jgi:CheY-like chemotaxis protein
MASILVVDDESEMCGLLQALLEPAGHRVVTTTEPRDVNRLLAEEPFDLVIADIVMPRRDGIELVRELHQTFPQLGIIAMSGAKPLRRELFFEAGKLFGADATFGKPFSKEEVMRSVTEALKKASERKPAA